ncbi:uncharacterized protein A4U43_C03F23000 [Asparagus officinalis]|uniref:Uncharacterized protein n=1 Tax=Asparagus officinalis TaxID=4686 RepID=A0A5P1FHF4_ASPOF|nr:uncharacterized protein A4U43_C03F23000 [Asparagus officinalis]
MYTQDHLYKRFGVVSPDVGGVARARAFAKKLSDASLAIVVKRPHGHKVAEDILNSESYGETANSKVRKEFFKETPWIHTCVGSGGERQTPEWYMEQGIEADSLTNEEG